LRAIEVKIDDAELFADCHSVGGDPFADNA
jgi:hypothetical protein